MRIALVGGVFDKSEEFRRGLRITPETTLRDGLQKRGHKVFTFGHHTYGRAGEFDVVHVHHFGRGALRAAVSGEAAAFVFTSHDGAGLCGLAKPTMMRVADDIVMRSADAIVALSGAERAYQRLRYGGISALHFVIPNGINSDQYKTPASPRQNGSHGPMFLFVGQLISLKRVDVLLRAASQVDRPISVVLVFHVDALRGELAELASELGMAERVRFLGPREPEELLRLYWDAAALVLPSEAEAQPSVLSEALLCGVPIIASDLPGIREHAGEFADLVPPGDVEAFAEALKRALIRDSQRDARIEAGRKYAIARYSIDAMVERHIEVYEAAIRAATVRKQNRTVPRALRLLADTGLKLL